ncbi:MAG: flagellar assembly protein FliW [Planctomycetes bacterium]|nr:flagellar assembly protein FliW [Planctomycetota bacterium]
MIIDSYRLGKIEVADDQIYNFSEGLVGFPSMARFAFFVHQEWAPFMFLQSLDLASLAFVVAESSRFFPSVNFPLASKDLDCIELNETDVPKIYLILTLYKQIELTTANLKGPLILNERRKLGRQIVLLNERYPTKAKIFEFEEV